MDTKALYIPAPPLVKTRTKFMIMVLFWLEKVFHMLMQMMMHENISPFRKKNLRLKKMV